ncbi:MAG: maltokinase N-terminal cap-like domain-containing protein [Acidimicrobiales bacterium]
MTAQLPAEARDLGPLLGPYLGRQRWFAGSEEEAGRATVVEGEVLRAGPPGLVWLLAGVDGVTYQILVGLRPGEEAAGLLQGQEAAVLGPVAGNLTAYDALVDPELTMVVLDLVSGGAERAERVRPVGAEQSNTSLIYDDRLILKVFRRVQAGPNPDVEVTLALDEVGFNHLAAPAGHWRRGDLDLAIAQEFLNGGSEGWSLALTSLRDLYARATRPFRPAADRHGTPIEQLEDDDEEEEAPGPEVAAAAGGDFGAEARRLGEMTARLHVALARAFGTEPGRPDLWAEDVTGQVAAARAAAERLGTDAGGAVSPELAGQEWAALLSSEVAGEAVAGMVGRLRAVEEPGVSIRVHGDYHLGQVMRTDLGWFVLDFEGEPARPLAERRLTRSPLKDVAGMLRSFHYATAVALKERGPDEPADRSGLDRAWEERNRASFLQGYLSTPEVAELLPGPDTGLEAVLPALEMEKAAYELTYEIAYRPGWADVPARALHRLLGGPRP